MDRIYTKDMPDIGQSITEFVAEKIKHGHNELFGDREDSHLESQLERTQYSLAKLTEILYERGILLQKDILSIVNMGDWEVKKNKVTFRAAE